MCAVVLLLHTLASIDDVSPESLRIHFKLVGRVCMMTLKIFHAEIRHFEECVGSWLLLQVLKVCFLFTKICGEKNLTIQD
ncbi:hypothetical protein BDP55DRAFT_399789 [Colletotrichum godetiae]|uniref:Uncharacterized protein n=1 Tax=Colletotrichum godetiae TaxID=1209918 RepID=A0AAJ0ACA6_9PEZI|nr:uncharacterized protein BDP55DRAFT_399789 [Colletotrichum godetiae]KAK1658330.1 hypothetical protein BDP55DRAFT_399789 [Colletotrichum godetiae]